MNGTLTQGKGSGAMEMRLGPFTGTTFCAAGLQTSMTCPLQKQTGGVSDPWVAGRISMTADLTLVHDVGSQTYSWIFLLNSLELMSLKISCFSMSK